MSTVVATTNIATTTNDDYINFDIQKKNNNKQQQNDDDIATDGSVTERTEDSVSSSSSSNGTVMSSDEGKDVSVSFASPYFETISVGSSVRDQFGHHLDEEDSQVIVIDFNSDDEYDSASDNEDDDVAKRESVAEAVRNGKCRVSRRPYKEILVESMREHLENERREARAARRAAKSTVSGNVSSTAPTFVTSDDEEEAAKIAQMAPKFKFRSKKRKTVVLRKRLKANLEKRGLA